VLTLLLLFGRRSKSNPDAGTESSSKDGALADSKPEPTTVGGESTPEPETKTEPEPEESSEHRPQA